MSRKFLFALVLSLLLIGYVYAGAGPVSISKPLIRPSTTPTTAGYFVLKNTSKEPLELIKVEFAKDSDSFSQKIELHNDKMEEQKSISFAPEKETKVKPGKFHIMFSKISKQLKMQWMKC
jgi:copper(I)-binding protein